MTLLGKRGLCGCNRVQDGGTRPFWISGVGTHSHGKGPNKDAEKRKPCRDDPRGRKDAATDQGLSGAPEARKDKEAFSRVFSGSVALPTAQF